MQNDIYAEYALLDAKQKEIKGQLESLRVKILEDLIARGVESEKHALGKFTVAKLKRWNYPEEVQAEIQALAKMEEATEALKAKAQNTGEATYEEVDSLRFTGNKF